MAGLECLMWTRAAVARRNINICEMPSHDDYLGAERRAGCRAQGACALKMRPLFSASVLGWSLLSRGCVGVVCPRSGSFLVVHGCQPWMPLAGLCGLRGPGSAFLPEYVEPPACCLVSCLLSGMGTWVTCLIHVGLPW